MLSFLAKNQASPNHAPRDGMAIAADMDRKMYHFMLVAIVGRLAMVDGDANSKEVLCFFDQFGIGDVERKELVQLIRQVRHDPLDIDYYVGRIREMYPDASKRYRSIVSRMFKVAASDAPLEVSELKFLKNLSRLFGLMESDYLELVRAHIMPPHATPHKVLGVHKLTGKRELKNAYKRALCDYHPDRFSGLDWAYDIAAIATARNAQLSQAYHAISG